MDSSEKSHFQGGGCRRGHLSNGGSLSWSGEHTQSGCPVRGQVFKWEGAKSTNLGCIGGEGAPPHSPTIRNPVYCAENIILYLRCISTTLELVKNTLKLPHCILGATPAQPQ